MKKTLAIMLALIMVLAMVPAFAEGEVAQIGGTKYATLDKAIEKAADSDTIVLLADCTTAGMNLSKNLTIDGGEAKRTISFNDKGIALWGKSLTFKNCKCGYERGRFYALYGRMELDGYLCKQRCIVDAGQHRDDDGRNKDSGQRTCHLLLLKQQTDSY